MAGTLARAGGNVASGAAAGSVIPGLGTAAGAAIGAGLTVLESIGSWLTQRDAEKRAEDERKRQEELLRQQTGEQRSIGRRAGEGTNIDARLQNLAAMRAQAGGGAQAQPQPGTLAGATMPQLTGIGLAGGIGPGPTARPQAPMQGQRMSLAGATRLPLPTAGPGTNVAREALLNPRQMYGL